MPNCIFVTDIHGSTGRYEKLFALIASQRPQAVFMGGDLTPHAMHRAIKSGERGQEFIADYLVGAFSKLRDSLKGAYPRVFVILGNDDPHVEEKAVIDAANKGVWEYLHERWADFGGYRVYGYACVPPTPFQLKDWERYDVSCYVDPGCVSPEDGWRSVDIPEGEKRLATIRKDLSRLDREGDWGRTILLLHTPPYNTNLDRAALDGKVIDHTPVDVHVGSIAVREFIEKHQPLVTLHGHVHESARITGNWQDRLGATYLYSASHDGPELAVVTFDPDKPQNARRELL